MVHPVPPQDHVVDRTPVAFVVPVHNDAIGLAGLLEALRREFVDETILVVDDASVEPESITQVCGDFDATVLVHEHNQGPGGARNSGWRHLQADGFDGVVMFLDADVRPQPGSIDRVLFHFTDPTVTAAAPRIQAAPGQGLLARYEAAEIPLDQGPGPGLVKPNTRIAYVPTAALAIRLQDLAAADGFADMRFGEDVDLIWRLADDDKAIRYEPKAVVMHRTRESVAGFVRQRFGYGTSAAPLARTHRSKVAPLQLPVDVVASTVGVLFGGPLVKVLSVANAGFRTKKLSDKLASFSDDPLPEAARLTLLWHRYALNGLASSSTRIWAPLLLLTSPTRKLLFTASAVPSLMNWFRTRPAVDPVTHLGLRALDHGAYCAGVWAGAVQERSVAALLPVVRGSDIDE